MAEVVTQDQIRKWIDDDLVAGVDEMEDNNAEFNLVVQLSGMVIHIIQRQPGGSLLIGQQIEYDQQIQEGISNLAIDTQTELRNQIQRTLMESKVVYGFRNQHGENVSLEEMQHIFLERRIYPDGASQQKLMDGLIDVWKAMRYLDDMWSIVKSLDQ